MTAAMRRYVEAVAAQLVPVAQGLGESRLTRPAPTDWNRQAEDYAQLLFLQPSASVEDTAVVIMLSDIEAT